MFVIIVGMELYKNRMRIVMMEISNQVMAVVMSAELSLVFNARTLHPNAIIAEIR